MNIKTPISPWWLWSYFNSENKYYDKRCSHCSGNGKSLGNWEQGIMEEDQDIFGRRPNMCVWMTKYLFLISHIITSLYWSSVLFLFSYFIIFTWWNINFITLFQLLCDSNHAAEYSWRKITTGSCFKFIIANFK